ncbi:MAG: molybdopterin-synthase adenylyltransferase MoeB [Acidobacteria bacterium]|nr:molybdopterin-synthase adenylyltransferase MoeB [Acidobacteriota bacterium]
MELSTREILRYQRHMRLTDFGKEGQLALKRARVLLVGAGGLGCPVGLYLAAAGVGSITVADGDQVELSNLQRQIGHRTAEVGLNKAQSLVSRMHAINDDIHYLALALHLGRGDVAVLEGIDLVIDGSDNFKTRYAMTDACHQLEIPYLYGAIQQFEGQVSLFDSRHGPCYRCLFPHPPPKDLIPSCEQAGVLGVLPGVIGVMMANEAIKYLTGVGQVLLGRVLIYDALEPAMRMIQLARDPECPLCSGLSVPVDEVVEFSDLEIDARAAHQLQQRGARFMDVRDEVEVSICAIEPYVHVPLVQLDVAALEVLDPTETWVVYCYDGIRSYRAVKFMRELGFERAVSLAGGIKAWTEQIDPNLAKY